MHDNHICKIPSKLEPDHCSISLYNFFIILDIPLGVLYKTRNVVSLEYSRGFCGMLQVLFIC